MTNKKFKAQDSLFYTIVSYHPHRQTAEYTIERENFIIVACKSFVPYEIRKNYE